MPRTALGGIWGFAPGLIVDLVTETWSVHNGQGDTGALLVKLEFYTASQSDINWVGIWIEIECRGSSCVPTV